MGVLLVVSMVVQVVVGFALYTAHMGVLGGMGSMTHSVDSVEATNTLLYSVIHSVGASVIFGGIVCHVGSKYMGSGYVQYTGLVQSGAMAYATTIVRGMVLSMLLMLVSFLGYVFVWGSMSYWGGTVILSLCSCLSSVQLWVLGGMSMSIGTVGFMGELHFILGILALLLVGVHLCVVHLG